MTRFVLDLLLLLLVVKTKQLRIRNYVDVNVIYSKLSLRRTPLGQALSIRFRPVLVRVKNLND